MMKHLLLTTIAAVVLVGCGNSELDENLRHDAYFGDIEAVKKHLDEGARVNSADSEFLTTALHDAASQGHYKIVKILIDNGAELNANDAEGMTPLDAAILVERRKKLDSEISDLLRSQGARSGAETSLLVATSLGDIQSIKKLLKAGLDINKPTSRGNTLLHVTASYGHKNATELLLASGANINAIDNQGRTPLFSAVSNAHKEIVELIISNGADINTDTGLHRLAVAYAYSDWSEEEQKQEKVRRSEKIEIAKLLISKGVDVNRKNHGDNALHIAAQSGHKEMAEQLIEAGVNIDESNNGNQTPLHKAAFEGRDEIVNMLIQKGAKVNPVIQSTGSFNGMTPVDFAIRQNELKTVALLRIHGGMTGEELKVTLSASNSAVSTYASGGIALNQISNVSGTGKIGSGVDDADSSIATVDASITALSGYIQTVGDTMVRLGKKEDFLSVSVANTDAVRSQYEDADFAVEQMELLKLQILQQTSVSALAQANSGPAVVLKLFGSF